MCVHSLTAGSQLTNIKSIVAAFFGVWFVEKYGGLRTHNPSAEEVRGLEVFFG
jgi:hypothetical protein